LLAETIVQDSNIPIVDGNGAKSLTKNVPEKNHSKSLQVQQLVAYN